jgi:hypothetical protein
VLNADLLSDAGLGVVAMRVSTDWTDLAFAPPAVRTVVSGRTGLKAIGLIVS